MNHLTNSRLRRNYLYLIGGALLLIFVTCASVFIELQHMRKEAEVRVATNSANLAKSMTLMFDGMIDTIDIALYDSSDEFDEEMATGKINVKEFTGYLARQQKHLPLVPYVRATDSNGSIIYGQGLNSPYPNIAGRDYFISHRDNPNLGLFVGKPIFSKVNQQWVWPFSRRLNNSDGTFAGVVYASIYVDQINKILTQITMSKGDVIGLRHKELGSIAGREESAINYPIQVGDDKVSAPFIEALKVNPADGTYASDSTRLDKLPRNFAYQRSQKYGFIVNVGTTGESVLEEWHRQVWIAGLLLTMFISTVIGLARLIWHSWRIQSRDLLALNEAHDLANFGNYKIDLRTDSMELSPSLNRILGVAASRVLKLDDWLAAIKTPVQDDLYAYWNEVLRSRELVDRECEFNRFNDQQTRWLHVRGKLKFDSAGQPNELVGTIQDITERKLAEFEIENLAYFDMLTGLPNRRLLFDRLTHALATGARKKQYSALLILDLDNFKSINDIKGHHVGDLLLMEVAARLSGNVRAGDSVARLGGDEFVVMLEGLSADTFEAVQQVEKVGEKILHSLNQPYQISDSEHHSTPSIGVVLFSGNHQTADELIKRADTAMYEAKAAGRNNMKFFDPGMQRTAEAQFKVENDLRAALAQKQFQLHYQPQIDSDNKVVGAEALIRWFHPELGMVSPANFIPIAEKCGLILPIGHWVLEEACAQLTQWARDPETAHLTLAVNVSALQFSQRNFVKDVISVLDNAGARAENLKLELTEGLLVENADNVIVKMGILKERGVGFSLDDFGTGYSSLSYLKRLPLDQLKIDQTFVRDVLTDVNDAAIAKTVIALGHSLGLSVIAEGVETAEQRDFLLGAGCVVYQGYFFSKPLALGAFEKFLKDQ